MDQENFNPNQIIDGNNESESTSVRVQKAKQFLEENPHECTITAARIYNLHPTTLYSALTANRPGSKPHGGHNKILMEHHKEAIHNFIRSLLANGIQPSYQLIFNA